MQLLRLAALCSVVAFFVLVPLSNWYANNKIAYNQTRLIELADGPFMATIYAALDAFYSLWDNPVRAATSNNGSLWAYTVLGIPISDPLGLIAELLNSVKFPVKYLMGGLIPFAITIVFGRVFCSWFCPMALIFGMTSRIRAFTDRFKVPLLRESIPLQTRTFLFWFGLILSHFMGAWVWHFILPYITFSHEIFSYVIFSSFTVGIYFLIALILLDFAVFPGEFCRSVCPTGLLLTWVGKLRIFRLKVDNTQCPKYCRQCLNVCPVKLYPRVDTQLDSCHLCFKCVNHCPKNIIEFGVSPGIQNLIKSSSGSSS